MSKQVCKAPVRRSSGKGLKRRTAVKKKPVTRRRKPNSPGRGSSGSRRTKPGTRKRQPPKFKPGPPPRVELGEGTGKIIFKVHTRGQHREGERVVSRCSAEFVLEECIAIGDDGDDKSWNASLVRLKPYKS